jgi:hypothetical protein
VRQRFRYRCGKLTVLLLSADGCTKMSTGKSLEVGAGTQDYMVFADHVSPERVRIGQRGEPEKNKVCGRRVGGKFE